MEPIRPYMAVGRPINVIAPRTPDELRILVRELQDEPEEWFVYSTHMNMAAAHNRASQLRGPATPNTILEYKDSLEWKAVRHAAHGPVVLVRWRITEDTTTVSP